MAQTKQSSSQIGLNELAGLASACAQVGFGTAVEAQKATEMLVHNWIEAGFSFQEANLRSTRDWLNSLHVTRRASIKRGAEMVEKSLTILPASIEYPFKKELEELNASLMEGMKKTLEIFAGPFARQ